MNKNINAIEKIISKLAFKDYATVNLTKNGKKRYKKYRSYSLSQDTLEALQIKKDYLNDIITEEEYKAYCLKFNLLKNK